MRIIFHPVDDKKSLRSDQRAVDGRQNARLMAMTSMLCLIAWSGCSEGVQAVPVNTPEVPTLALAHEQGDALNITIAGSYALRALQFQLVYDPTMVRVSKVDPGKQATRLDRFFYSDPAQDPGTIIIGIADTRQVLLPARGTLVQLTLEPQGGSSAATVTVKDPLGALDGGKAVALTSISTEVTFP